MAAAQTPAKRTCTSSSMDSACQPQASIQTSYLTIPRLVSSSAPVLSQARLHQDLEGQEEYWYPVKSEFQSTRDYQFKYIPHDTWKILIPKLTVYWKYKSTSYIFAH